MHSKPNLISGWLWRSLSSFFKKSRDEQSWKTPWPKYLKYKRSSRKSFWRRENDTSWKYGSTQRSKGTCMEQISFAHIPASTRWKAANEEMVETDQRSGKHISWSFAEGTADNSTSREEKKGKNSWRRKRQKRRNNFKILMG